MARWCRCAFDGHANELAFGTNGSGLRKGGFADEIMAFQIDQTTKARQVVAQRGAIVATSLGTEHA